MNKNIVIGVDIGGSHITSAAVDLNIPQIIDGTLFSGKVDNKASKEVIFENWSKVIQKSIHSANLTGLNRIGFAIPGPFHYKTGLAMYEKNDKYESLYNVSVPDELIKFFKGSEVEFRYLNDATSFGVGVASMGEAKKSNKLIALTLGTGFGSTFVKHGIPQVTSEDVPEGGCLWDKPFKEGIADDYFSTRWFINKYHEISSIKLKGAKEIAEADNEFSKAVFEEFSYNLAKFMIPVIKKYKPDLIVLGGNISNANALFLPELKNKLKEKNLDTNFTISSLMEEAAIIGSAKLYDSAFWDQVKNDLPNL